MIINKNIKHFINILIGVFFVGFILHRRFIVVRVPKDLHVFDEIINIVLCITILIGFLFSIYQIIINIYYLITKYNLKSNMFTKLQEFTTNALLDLYIVICSYIPDIYDHVSLLAENFYAKFHKQEEYLLLFILYFIRFIIVLAFLIDVFVFFKLDFFYKMLSLLIISLIIKTVIYILRDFASNVEDAKSFLIIEDKGFDTITQLPITEFSLKEEYKKLNLHYYIKQYLLCSKVDGYFKRYDLYSAFFNPYVNIFIYSLYFLGWSYILFINIQHFISFI